MKKLAYSLLLISMLGSTAVKAQAPASDDVKKTVETTIQSTVPAHMGIGAVKINSMTVDEKKATMNIDLNENYSYVPFTETTLAELKKNILLSIAPTYNSYTINFSIDGDDINNYLPLFTSSIERKADSRFVTSLEPTDHCSKGLDGNIIALWQSHGWYFEPSLNRWEWQRARIFQTVEDLYTQSYVMPFLMPMLENAGAYVLSPRERDVNSFEQIVDEDGALAYQGYREHKKGEKWKKGDSVGFAYNRIQYEGFENPFKEGSYRVIKATKNKKKISSATWDAEVPADGNYAVYVSYATLPTSVDDAIYKVNSENGTNSFLVNQKMGGGTCT